MAAYLVVDVLFSPFRRDMSRQVLGEFHFDVLFDVCNSPIISDGKISDDVETHGNLNLLIIKYLSYVYAD